MGYFTTLVVGFSILTNTRRKRATIAFQNIWGLVDCIILAPADNLEYQTGDSFIIPYRPSRSRQHKACPFGIIPNYRENMEFTCLPGECLLQAPGADRWISLDRKRRYRVTSFEPYSWTEGDMRRSDTASDKYFGAPFSDENEIEEDLEAALEEFRESARDLGMDNPIRENHDGK